MNSILICSFVAICATVVQGESDILNEGELKLLGMQNRIISDIDSFEYFINNTILLGSYKIQSRASETITKPLAEAVHKIRLELDKVGEKNEKAANCYKKGHVNALEACAVAVRDINPCVEKYLGLHDEAIKNITHIIQKYKELYNQTKLLSSTPCVEKEGKPDECSSKRLLILEIAYTELAQHSESVHVNAYQAEYDESEVMNDCVNNHTATLRKNLEKLQSESIACIKAS